ncbi:putative low complexity with coiled coil regions [Cryptosporidium sp. chipmunk genotype I]|uniref:putative low complexity with coiled coil regions n=1 Tax=Cryptosporidium sp. chipmunk genotype I TaxID=1280935 RepID=UPI00351A4672|nr:putative low complexity with coiled coil regions [Cryptosporidium sp. chipmunk genotype I]
MDWQLELEKKLEKVKENEDLWVVIEDAIVEILEREEKNEQTKISKGLNKKIFEILRDSLKDNNWSCCNSCLRFIWTLIQYKSLRYNDIDEKNIKVLMNVYYSIVSVSQKNQVVELEFATLLRNITGFFMSWVDEYYLEISKMDIEDTQAKNISEQTPMFMKDKVMLEKYIYSLFELLTMIEPKRSNCNGVLEYLYIGHSFILSSRYAAETYTMIQQISSIQKSNCYLPFALMEICIKRFLSCPDFDLQLILGELIWRVLKKSNYGRGCSQGENEELSFVEVFRSLWPEGLIQLRYIGTENFDFSFRGLLTPWNKTCNGNGKNIWSLSGVLIQMQGLEIKLVTVIDICAFSIVFHSDIDEDECYSNQPRHSIEMGNTEEKDLKPFVSTAEIPYWTVQSVVYDDNRSNLHINIVFSEILEIKQSWTGIFSTNIENLQIKSKMKNDILKVSLSIDEEQAYQIMGIFKASKIEKIQGMKHIETPSRKVSIVDSRIVSIKELNRMDHNNIILESVENRYKNVENVKMSIATSKITPSKNNLYNQQIDEKARRVSFVSSKECSQADSDRRSSNLVVKELESENMILDSNIMENSQKKNKADVIIIGLINEQKKLTQEIKNDYISSDSSESDLNLDTKEFKEEPINISNPALLDKNEEFDSLISGKVPNIDLVLEGGEDIQMGPGKDDKNMARSKKSKSNKIYKSNKSRLRSKNLKEDEIEEESKEKTNLRNLKVKGRKIDKDGNGLLELECHNAEAEIGEIKKEVKAVIIDELDNHQKEEKDDNVVNSTFNRSINLKRGKKKEIKGKEFDEEELSKRKEKEEELGKIKENEEDLKKRKDREEELRKKKEEEEELRKRKEKEEELKDEEEELRKKKELKKEKKEEEELRKRKEKENFNRKKEEELRKKKEELSKRKEKEEELGKIKENEEDLKKRKDREEELRKKKEEEQRKKREEEEELSKRKQKEELRKRKEEELKKKKREDFKKEKEANEKRDREVNLAKVRDEEIERAPNSDEKQLANNKLEVCDTLKEDHEGKEAKKVTFPFSTLDQTNKRASGLKRGRFNKEHNELKMDIVYERVSYNTVRDIVFGKNQSEKSDEFREKEDLSKKGNKKEAIEVFTPITKRTEAPKSFKESIITVANDTTCPTRMKGKEEGEEKDQHKQKNQVKMMNKKEESRKTEIEKEESKSIVPMEIAVVDNEYPILGNFDELKENEEIEKKKRKYSSDSRSDKLLNMWISEIKGQDSNEFLQYSNESEEKTPKIINIGLNKRKKKLKQKSKSKIKEVSKNIYYLDEKNFSETNVGTSENYDLEETKSVIFSGINKIFEQITESETKGGFDSINSGDFCDNLSCITGTEILDDLIGKSKKRELCNYSLKSFNSIGKMSMADSIFSPDATFDDNVTVTNYSFIGKLKEKDNDGSGNQNKTCSLPSDLCISKVKLDENKQLENALTNLEITSKGLYEKCQKKLEAYFISIKSSIENMWSEKINVFSQKRKNLTLKVEANRHQIENDYLNLHRKYITDLEMIGEKINKEKAKFRIDHLEKEKNTNELEQSKLSLGKKVLVGLKEEIEREKKRVQISIKLLSEKKEMERNKYRKSTTKKLDLRQILKNIINEESE